MPAARSLEDMACENSSHSHLFQIVDPCNRVIAQKECSGTQDSLVWLRLVQFVKKDPFLTLERFDGTGWIGQSEPAFSCCTQG